MSSRIRSARTRKRIRKESFDKYLLGVERKKDELRKHDVYYERLPHPIQRGYVRTFVLTDEAAHSPNVEIYRNILTLINTCQYSCYPIFNDKLGKKKSRKLKRAYNIQELRNIRPEEYTMLDEREKKMFAPIYSYGIKGRYIEEYCFKYTWLFKLVVVPYMVDKVELLDGDVKSQYAFYDKITYVHFNRLSKMHGYYWKSPYSIYKDDIAKFKAKGFKNIPVWKRADMFENDAPLLR